MMDENPRLVRIGLALALLQFSFLSVWPYFAYGPELMMGGDELLTIERARGMVGGGLRLQQNPNYPAVLEPSPPGYSVLLGTVMASFDDYSFVVYAVMRIMLSVFIILALW